MYNSALNLTRLLGLAAIGAVIAGCGSGDSSGDPPPAGFARISAEVKSDDSAISGALVGFQTSENKYTCTTGDSGKCTFDMPLAEVDGVREPAATATKDGYEPQMYPCPGFSRNNPTCPAKFDLNRLGQNVSIPVEGDEVWHIGDSNYQGQPNSQLQKKIPDGTFKEFEIADWAVQVAKSNVTKVTVVLDHKGWQTDICPNNSIALVGDAGEVSRAGGNSPDTGGWGGGTQEAQPFDFMVSKVGSSRATIRISAGECRGGTDLDDFEINRMRVYFCGDDKATCIPER
jgi:hypothetical protein